jgi:hypothetical protein
MDSRRTNAPTTAGATVYRGMSVPLYGLTCRQRTWAVRLAHREDYLGWRGTLPIFASHAQGHGGSAACTEALPTGELPLRGRRAHVGAISRSRAASALASPRVRTSSFRRIADTW